ncbi:hypothetical protein [Streptoalloteichus hindustanus]|uniref:Uncharacterized protein n=1 Tax=Streptoalloteichus hindustanus TaxID=2017 RepID=A0A1M4U2Z4_STRHI|nr:hypothetical protein [Streptoalloteichus hindustanus]SHE51171.1 hypothetical protein SAMN05444320_101281 [Streptoalloteichus hindustanus]
MSGTGTARGWGERLRVAVLRLAAVGGLTAAAWLTGAAAASATEAPVRDGSSSPAVVAEQDGRPAEAPARAGVHGHRTPHDHQKSHGPRLQGHPAEASRQVGADHGVPTPVGGVLGGITSVLTNGALTNGGAAGVAKARPETAPVATLSRLAPLVTLKSLPHPVHHAAGASLERLEGRLAELPTSAPLPGLGAPASPPPDTAAHVLGDEHGDYSDYGDYGAYGEYGTAAPPPHHRYEAAYPGPGPRPVGRPAPATGPHPATPSRPGPQPDFAAEPGDTPTAHQVDLPGPPAPSAPVAPSSAAEDETAIPRWTAPSRAARPESTAPDSGQESADGALADSDSRSPLLPDPPPRPLPSPSSLASGGGQEGGGARGVAGVLSHQPSVPEPAGARAERSAGTAAVGGLPRRPVTSPD